MLKAIWVLSALVVNSPFSLKISYLILILFILLVRVFLQYFSKVVGFAKAV